MIGRPRSVGCRAFVLPNTFIALLLDDETCLAQQSFCKVLEDTNCASVSPQDLLGVLSAIILDPDWVWFVRKLVGKTESWSNGTIMIS